MLGYFGHVYKLPMKFFATRKTGKITTRYSDANTIKSVFTSIALSLVMDIVMAVATGIVLFRMNATLFSISLFMTLVSILLVLVYLRPYKKLNEETMQQSAVLNSQMIESLRGIETIKCNANEDTELENLEREYIKSLKINLRGSRLSTSQSLILLADRHRIPDADYLCGYLSGTGWSDDLGCFHGVLHLVRLLHLSGERAGGDADLLAGGFYLDEASDRVLDYESEDEGDENRTEMEKIDGDIEFKDVTFRYGNRAPALDHVSFTIPRGRRLRW